MNLSDKLLMGVFGKVGGQEFLPASAAAFKLAARCNAEYGGVWVPWDCGYTNTPHAFFVVIIFDRFSKARVANYNPNNRFTHEEHDTLSVVRDVFVSDDGELVDANHNVLNIPNFLARVAPLLAAAQESREETLKAEANAAREAKIAQEAKDAADAKAAWDAIEQNRAEDSAFADAFDAAVNELKNEGFINRHEAYAMQHAGVDCRALVRAKLGDSNDKSVIDALADYINESGVPKLL